MVKSPPLPAAIFCFKLGKPNKNRAKTKKIRFFATCLAFCTVFAYKKTKSVQKSSQVAEKQKNFLFFSARPRDSATAATAPPPGAPRATPAPSLPEGRATPGSAPRNVARPRGTAAMPGVCPTSPRPGVVGRPTCDERLPPPPEEPVRVLSGGSRACFARFGDYEPSLGGVGVLL